MIIFHFLVTALLSEIKVHCIIGFISIYLCRSGSGYIQRSVNVRYDDDEPGNHIYTDKINSILSLWTVGQCYQRTHFYKAYFDLSITLRKNRTILFCRNRRCI